MSQAIDPGDLAAAAASVNKVAEALHQLAAAADLAAVKVAQLAAAQREWGAAARQRGGYVGLTEDPIRGDTR